jgi:archaellum component FlaC
MNGKRAFEDRVFARFDAIDARLNGVDARFDTVDSSIGNLDVRLQRLEVRACDTKPVWEQVLKEIVDTKRELSMRLDRIEVVVRQNHADLRKVQDRLDEMGRKPIR